ncbi:MAG: hypothetical protein EA397_14880 [Deltaproteobacteria bacterium]|nr:MAG: hypothetical protein EA397_14880 [Deltaproteobacteria bacterium]
MRFMTVLAALLATTGCEYDLTAAHHESTPNTQEPVEVAGVYQITSWGEALDACEAPDHQVEPPADYFFIASTDDVDGPALVAAVCDGEQDCLERFPNRVGLSDILGIYTEVHESGAWEDLEIHVTESWENGSIAPCRATIVHNRLLELGSGEVELQLREYTFDAPLDHQGFCSDEGAMTAWENQPCRAAQTIRGAWLGPHGADLR